LPNVGPYIYDVSISGFTRSSIYIHDISSLRVKQGDKFTLFIFAPFINTESDTSLGDGSHGYDFYGHSY